MSNTDPTDPDPTATGAPARHDDHPEEMSMGTQPNARHVPLSRVDKLRQDAADAARVRAFQTHPDVVALRVESVRSQVDTLMWVGIVLGLAFTMVNVQTFAAAGSAAFTLAWFAAWLLDPMVSLVLIAVLRAEQVTARYQVPTGVWVRRTKVFAFAATYVMNTWASWAALHAAGIVLHSVPPILVYCAAEAGPTVRDRLTEAVTRAARQASTAASPAAATDTHDPTPAATHDNGGTAPAAFTTDAVNTPLAAPANPPMNTAVNAGPVPGGTVHEPAMNTVAERRAPARRAGARTTRTPARRQPARRMLKADYVAQARAAWTPGTHVTPAWVREVTDCSRGMSSQVAADLKTELHHGDDAAQTVTSPMSFPDTTPDVPVQASESEAA